MRNRVGIKVAIVAVLLLFGASACSSGSSSSGTVDDEGKVVGFRPSPTRRVGTRSLPDYSVDPNGVVFPIKAAPGNLLVVYFGYLTCPDICPVTMADTAAGIAELPTDVADHIEIAFVTVDIERDTGARLNEYLAHFFPGSTTHSLRAPDASSLNAVAYEFGAQWQVDPHPAGATTYGVAHSGVTYVVDDKGQLVWEWPFGTIGPDVAASLQQLYSTIHPSS